MPTENVFAGTPSPRAADASHARLSVRATHAVRTTDEVNWADLCGDLIREFPRIESGDVIEEVARARSATSLFGLDIAEQYHATATIARNNLRLLSGEHADLARLDPETHQRRQQAG